MGDVAILALTGMMIGLYFSTFRRDNEINNTRHKSSEKEADDALKHTRKSFYKRLFGKKDDTIS